MRTFVITDIHGCSKEFNELLNKVNFNNEEDKLINLGDFCDRGIDSKGVIERLLQIKNLISIKGNHDYWFLDYLSGTMDLWNRVSWIKQGGEETIKSFKDYPLGFHDFCKTLIPYYIDEENRIFLHGGFSPTAPIEEHSEEHLMWDRDLYYHVLKAKKRGESKVSPYKEIFIGHTPTTYLTGSTEPINILNLWCMDTGKVYGGKLTLMDVNTKEYWQV